MTKPMTPGCLTKLKAHCAAATRTHSDIVMIDRQDLRACLAEIGRLQAREDEWAKLLKSANNDVERLNEYINTLQGE